MTLEEIFEDKPELLSEPCVQKLIEHVKQRHTEMRQFIMKAEKQYDDVIEKCMYSEVMLIQGKPSKEVITDILTEYGKN